MDSRSRRNKTLGLGETQRGFQACIDLRNQVGGDDADLAADEAFLDGE
jgi:hypothetical protein